MKVKTKKQLLNELEKAQDEKNRFEAIVAAIGDGIIIQDTDYKIIYQNQVQNEIYGDRTGELCYKTYEGIDEICQDCPIEMTFRDGKIHRSERRVVTDKGVSYFELTSSPLKDSSGKIIAGIKIVRDITTLKRVENELREGERFLESIFSSIQDGIGVIDTKMNIIRVNKTAQGWYPHAVPFVGKKCYEAYHNRKEPCEQCPARETLRTGKSSHEIVPKHDKSGKVIGWLEIYSYPLNDMVTGTMNGVIEYVRDITERRHIEEELKQSEEKYRLLIENINEGVFVIQDAKMVFVNQMFAHITGYGIEEII
jgi:PAS domain S-box-containing protein